MSTRRLSELPLIILEARLSEVQEECARKQQLLLAMQTRIAALESTVQEHCRMELENVAANRHKQHTVSVDQVLQTEAQVNELKTLLEKWQRGEAEEQSLLQDHKRELEELQRLQMASAAVVEAAASQDPQQTATQLAEQVEKVRAETMRLSAAKEAAEETLQSIERDYDQLMERLRQAMAARRAAAASSAAAVTSATPVKQPAATIPPVVTTRDLEAIYFSDIEWPVSWN